MGGVAGCGFWVAGRPGPRSGLRVWSTVVIGAGLPPLVTRPLCMRLAFPASPRGLGFGGGMGGGGSPPWWLTRLCRPWRDAWVADPSRLQWVFSPLRWGSIPLPQVSFGAWREDGGGIFSSLRLRAVRPLFYCLCGYTQSQVAVAGLHRPGGVGSCVRPSTALSHTFPNGPPVQFRATVLWLGRRLGGAVGSQSPNCCSWSNAPSGFDPRPLLGWLSLDERGAHINIGLTPFRRELGKRFWGFAPSRRRGGLSSGGVVWVPPSLPSVGSPLGSSLVPLF